MPRWIVPAEDAASYTDQAELDPIDLLTLAAGHINTGVLTGCGVTASVPPDDDVVVAAGTYRINANPWILTGGVVHVLSGAANPDGSAALAADANYFRYDLIVANASNQRGVIHGTVPNPTWPNYRVNPRFPDVDFTTHCLLGALLIPPTAASITGISTNEIVCKDLPLKGQGLPFYGTGAGGTTRYGGATASAAPTTGTWAVGDFVIVQTGKIVICTVAGTPGTWVQVGGTAATGGALSADVTTSETTTSTTYAALTTAGPEVSATIGASGLALVTVSASMSNANGSTIDYSSFGVDGATPLDVDAAYFTTAGLSGGAIARAQRSTLVTGLSAAAHTFTMKYKVSGGTGTFLNRRITVVPL